MKRRLTRATLLVTILALLGQLAPGAGGVLPSQPAAAQGRTIVYNLYATDGYAMLADGTMMYIYGFVGGRQGEPMTYLDAAGNRITLPQGPPAPTGGPVQPGVEAQLLGNAQLPGPVIYANVGDVVEIRLKNLGVNNPYAPNDPHTIHLHGVDVDAANDGVPETSVAAVPANSGFNLGAGNVVVYMFTATQAGTYMYHCHQEADIHVQMGMYGALVVYNPTDPAAATGPGRGMGGNLYGWDYDKDYVMLLTEIDMGQHLMEETAASPAPFVFNPVLYKPQYWLINGLSFPNTVHVDTPGVFNWANWIQAYPNYDPFITGRVNSPGTNDGERVLVRMINLGFETQPMHIHGFHPKIIGGDQRSYPWANPPGTPFGEGLERNTFLIGSGQTYELLIDFGQQTVNSTYPSGATSPPSTFPGGTQSKQVDGFPVSSTSTNGQPIPDPFTVPFDYIAGPVVTGLVGHADPVSQYFPWHNHDDYKATNNGVYPGGQFTMVRTDPPLVPGAPAAPTSLSGTAVSQTQVNLTWTDNANNETGFEVERSQSAAFTAPAIFSVDVQDATSFSDTAASPDTPYYYRVFAVNAGGRSLTSNVTQVTTPPAPLEPPAAPANLVATAVSANQVILAWSDASTNEDGFVVQRSTDAAFAETVEFTIPLADETFYSDFTAAAGTQYWYRVLAENAAGRSAPSNTANATTQSLPTTPPVAPSDLSAVPISATRVDLEWIDNANNESRFVIERSTDSMFTEPTSFVVEGANVTTYSDATVNANTTYWYQVFAENAGGLSATSNVAQVTTPAGPGLPPPAAPTNLVAKLVNPTQIDLTWTDNATNETSFVVERWTPSAFGAPTSITLMGADLTSYSDTTVQADTVYWYRVYARNASGRSAASNMVELATMVIVTPGAPTDLEATAVTFARVDLTWTDNANNESSYVVERSTDTAFTAPVSFTISANATTYSDLTVAASTQYWYRVFAANVGGRSLASNTATATTSAAPPPTESILLPLIPRNATGQ